MVLIFYGSPTQKKLGRNSWIIKKYLLFFGTKYLVFKKKSFKVSDDEIRIMFLNN